MHQTMHRQHAMQPTPRGQKQQSNPNQTGQLTYYYFRASGLSVAIANHSHGVSVIYDFHQENTKQHHQ